MRIAGYLQTSFLEWPGQITAVIFLPGCNFRCPFCHNKDLVLPSKRSPSIPGGEILADLKKRKKWIDGVVFTGGEPTLQSDLDAFLRAVKDLGFLAMVETNGTRPEILKVLLEKKLVDRIGLDVKACLDKESYQRAVGGRINLEAIEESIKIVFGSRIEGELRTTLVPGIHSKENLIKLASQLEAVSRQFPTADQSPVWFLQQFQPKNCLDPAFEKVKPYDQKSLEEILAAVKRHFPRTKLRGI